MSEALFQTLKKDRMAAMKAKDKEKVSTLSSLIGDIENDALTKQGAKAKTDDKVVAKIKALVGSYNEMIRDNGERADWRAEIDKLSVYLPQEASEEELRAVIEPLKAEGAQIGQVMGAVKKQFGASADMQKAKEIFLEG